jgi:hypothetical protein
MYFLIKDSVNLYEDYDLMKITCYACGVQGHPAFICPQIHFIPDKQKCFNEMLGKKRRIDRKFRRQNRKRFNARMNLDILQRASSVLLLKYSPDFFDYEKEAAEANIKGSKESFSAIAIEDVPLGIGKSKNSIKESKASTVVADHFVNRKNTRKAVRHIKQSTFDGVRNYVCYFPHNNINMINLVWNKKLDKIQKKRDLQREIQTIKELISRREINTFPTEEADDSFPMIEKQNFTINEIKTIPTEPNLPKY